ITHRAAPPSTTFAPDSGMQLRDKTAVAQALVPAVSRLVSTRVAGLARCRAKSVPMSGDAAGRSACATFGGRFGQILVGLVLFACVACAAELPYFSVLSEDAGAWPQILASVGLQRQPAGVSRIFVARTGASASVEWPARVQRLSDVHRPGLPIVWEKGLELPLFEIPQGAQVFARERWSGAPMTAGLK